MVKVKESDIQHIEPLQLFKLLYRHARPIKKWVVANSGSSSDAEDILQDAMIVFYQMIHRPEFVLTAKPETLLFSISKKLWYYQLRKNNRLPLTEFSELDVEEGPDADAIEKEDKLNLMEKSLALLGDQCSRLLELFYFRKMDMAAIAVELGFRNDKVAKAMKYKCLEKARILINTKTNDRI